MSECWADKLVSWKSRNLHSKFPRVLSCWLWSCAVSRSAPFMPLPPSPWRFQLYWIFKERKREKKGQFRQESRNIHEKNWGVHTQHGKRQTKEATRSYPEYEALISLIYFSFRRFIFVLSFWKKMMMMTMEGMMDTGVLDDIIRRLLEGKGGKQVQLSESEIRQLCVNARQVFLSQPNLLRLRAPIRICGLSFLS